jgi:hypothetical protein
MTNFDSRKVPISRGSWTEICYFSGIICYSPRLTIFYLCFMCYYDALCLLQENTSTIRLDLLCYKVDHALQVHDFDSLDRRWSRRSHELVAL